MLDEFLKYNFGRSLVFVRGECVSILSDSMLQKFYKDLDKFLSKADIFLLTNSMDSCHDIQEIDNWNGFMIYYSKSPNDIHGFAIKKDDEYLLDSVIDSDQMSQKIISGKWRALTSYPRIFNRKINKSYEENNHLLFPCRNEEISMFQNHSNLSHYYFVIACLFIIFFLGYRISTV